MIDASYNYPSKKQYTDLVYMLDHQWLEWFYQNYTHSDQKRYHPHFSPIYFNNSDRLPLSLFILARLDPMHDEALIAIKQTSQWIK